MIFSSFRDSVQEIAEMLLPHQPVIRVMTFVGHASGKSMKGFTEGATGRQLFLSY